MNVLALPRSHSARLIASLALFALAMAALALIVTYRSVCSCPIGGASPGDTALTYAQQHMVWIKGPTVQSSRTVELRGLEPALARAVSPTLRRDVNVEELLHRYGPNRQVTLVILNGVYNTLPPDEGVTVRGAVVVLVDARTDRVLLMTD